jgi:hypothetical protein
VSRANLLCCLAILIRVVLMVYQLHERTRGAGQPGHAEGARQLPRPFEPRLIER